MIDSHCRSRQKFCRQSSIHCPWNGVLASTSVVAYTKRVQCSVGNRAVIGQLVLENDA